MMSALVTVVLTKSKMKTKKNIEDVVKWHT